MIAEMPRPRPPHVHRQVTRHGKTVWYVRVGKGHRVRLRPEYGSPEFDAEYQAALGADSAYGSASNLDWLVNEQGIAPHVPVIDKSQREDGTFSREDFS